MVSEPDTSTSGIENKELRITYCPTEEMIADYLTKPLQGVLFRKMRDALMGIHHQASSASIFPVPVEPEECVEDDGTWRIVCSRRCVEG